METVGSAFAVTILLRDYENFGLEERVAYHFRLSEALEQQKPEPLHPAAADENYCGVVKLLECIPTTQWHRLKKPQKKALKKELRLFHERLAHSQLYCREPTRLPLRLTPASKVTFCYERTRIALVVDASLTLTTTFGHSLSDAACCPLDRLAPMVQTYFTALVQPLDHWQPVLDVTVLAALSNGETLLLVRDFRVDSVASAQQLATHVVHWTTLEDRLGAKTTNVRDLLQAGDAALSILSSQARPYLLLATDGRSVSCAGGILDRVLERTDVPVSILDLSAGPSSGSSGGGGLWDDPSGPSFPLHLSDDTEALYGVAHATGGCFWDQALLQQAAQERLGAVTPPLSGDPLLCSKKHAIHPNVVQWYTLFATSPIVPSSQGGRLVPPAYLEERLPRRRSLSHVTVSTYIVNPIRIMELVLMRVKEGYRARQYGQSTNDPDKAFIQFVLPLELGTVLQYQLSYTALPGYNHMVGFANIKVELSGEPDFVQSVKNDFVQGNRPQRPLTLSQQVSSRLCHVLRWLRQEDMLQSYLSPLKWSDQLRHVETPFVRRLVPLTAVQMRRHFRGYEFDCVCTGAIAESDDDFLREFRDTSDGSDELVAAVKEWSTISIGDWENRKLFVRRVDSGDDSLAAYCIVGITRSPIASRLYTVALDFFGTRGSVDRVEILSDIKRTISNLKDVHILSKRMSECLVTRSKGGETPRRVKYLEGQHNMESWELVKAKELVPLLVKRRTEIGNFFLLESRDDYALFAKIVSEGDSGPGTMVQYQLSILDDRVLVSLHVESESGFFRPSTVRREDASLESDLIFHRLVKTLRKRDQECGLALRCRMQLLRVFLESPEEPLAASNDWSCVERLLGYSSDSHVKLRFFQGQPCSHANEVLASLLSESLLGMSSVRRIELVQPPDTGYVQSQWFVAQHDGYTMSILQFPKAEGLGEADDAHRVLSLHTISIGDVSCRPFSSFAYPRAIEVSLTLLHSFIALVMI